MKFHFTPSFIAKAKKLCSKDAALKSSLAKQFNLFQINPKHPSLKLHKLTGKRSSQYAIWIRGDLRALSVKEDQTYIFFDLVTHDQY